jgi:hypothetical protein
VLPTKCPVKRKLDCVCVESENTELEKIQDDAVHLGDDVVEASDQSQGNGTLMDTESHSVGNELDHQNVGTPLNKKYVVCNPATTSALYARRKVSKAPLVVTEVRRSIRSKGKIKGLKIDACNLAKDYLCFAVDPPPPHTHTHLVRKSNLKLGKGFL